MKIVNAVSSNALSFAIVIIKKDGSEEFSTYHEYAEKLSNALHIKRSFDDGETSPTEWMEYFAKEESNRSNCLHSLERYAKLVDKTVYDIISRHEWKRKLLRALIIAKAVERVTKSSSEALGDKEYIVEYSFPNYDDDFGGHGESRKTYSAEDMLEEIYDEDLSWRRRFRPNYAPSCLRGIKTEKDLLSAFADKLENDECFVSFIGSEEDYRKLEQKRRREELEGLAAEVAHKHKVGVRSIEFLKAVQKEIDAVNYEHEDWNNPEVRAEEWMAVRYNGLNSDVYFDDLNFVNGRIGSRLEDLYGIMEWVGENCPMLYAQYCEEKKNESEEEGSEEMCG